MNFVNSFEVFLYFHLIKRKSGFLQQVINFWSIFIDMAHQNCIFKRCNYSNQGFNHDIFKCNMGLLFAVLCWGVVVIGVNSVSLRNCIDEMGQYASWMGSVCNILLFYTHESETGHINLGLIQCLNKQYWLIGSSCCHRRIHFYVTPRAVFYHLAVNKVTVWPEKV